MSTNSILTQMPIDLGDNLISRFARPNDVDALAEFNARVFEDEKVGVGIRGLMSGRHPTVKASDFTVVEDTRTNKIVSSMCLISQMWAYCGIPFKFGRPEVVVTEPEYRRRGLVRKQFEVIHALSAAKGELMQGITGIPWYYRQFGYEMAMEVDGGRAIAGIDLPKLKDGDSEKYHLRPAVEGDARFPDLTFLQLLCGRRRFNELKTNFVDCGGQDEAGVLLDCLFPPFTGNVWCFS